MGLRVEGGWGKNKGRKLSGLRAFCVCSHIRFEELLRILESLFLAFIRIRFFSEISALDSSDMPKTCMIKPNDILFSE
jgi:hypothetical protein